MRAFGEILELGKVKKKARFVLKLGDHSGYHCGGISSSSIVRICSSFQIHLLDSELIYTIEDYFCMSVNLWFALLMSLMNLMNMMKALNIIVNASLIVSMSS